MKQISLFLLQISMSLLAGSQAFGEKLPAWQIGLGGGALNIPDYRGSDQSDTYLYPFIMPIFRGERLQADEDGIRGLLFDSDDIKFDISLDGSVPVKSRDNAAREGMPDLDPVIQIGPMLRIKLWERKDGPYHALSLNLPVRTGVSIGSGLDHIGWTSFPHLTYRHVVPIRSKPWRLGLTGGLLWGSEDFHDYYYQVAPEYATEGRPAYNAEAGFGGGRLIGTFSHIGRDTFFSAYALYDRVDGASFEDSPLVRSRDGFTVGFVVTWFLFNSERMVEVSHDRW